MSFSFDYEYCAILAIFKIFVGGIFRLYMKFSETYNYTPPEICFHTIPFHPNSKYRYFQKNILSIASKNDHVWKSNFSWYDYRYTMAGLFAWIKLETIVHNSTHTPRGTGILTLCLASCLVYKGLIHSETAGVNAICLTDHCGNSAGRIWRYRHLWRRNNRWRGLRLSW